VNFTFTFTLQLFSFYEQNHLQNKFISRRAHSRKWQFNRP
jgi:hypothetical protein